MIDSTDAGADHDGAPPHAGISRASIGIAAFSTIVEWYDFTLYLYFVTVLSRVFFAGELQASLLATLAGFAVAYLMRPVGALVFGYIGDRHGRRITMLLSMALMSLAMLITALLPTYAQIGPAAGAILLLVRCTMGFAVGGEYTGVVAYLMEGAPPGRRGLVTSLAAAASEIGALLAVGLSALTVTLFDEATLASWGWRIPFLVGSLLAGAVLVARSRMQESPEFARTREAGNVPTNPVVQALACDSAGIARGFAISALGSITYYVGITYVPAFLGSVGTIAEGESLWLATIAAVAVIAVTPLFGAASDRWGRRPLLVGLAIASAVLPISMFALMAGESPGKALGAAIVLACVAGGVSAVGAVATAEQLRSGSRLSGLALGATSATALFGGLTPYVAQLLIGRTGSPLVPGAMIAVVALCVLPILIKLPEIPAREQR